MSFFRKLLLGSEVKLESCQISKMELFIKNSQKRKAVHYFLKTSFLDVLQGFEYASELASKVTDVSFLSQFEYQGNR